MFIYKITNKINGKVYVGQTTQTVELRWKQHCKSNSTCSILSSAIKKYNKDNFIVEQIDIAETIEELNIKETYWIGHYDSFGKNGYNLTSGGENFIRSDITKAKMRKPRPEEVKQKMRKPKSEEHRKNISKGKMVLKRDPFSEECRSRMSTSHEGQKNIMYGKIGYGAKKVKCLNNEKIYASIAAAARDLNLFSQSISSVLNKKYSHTKGFVFQYVEE